MRWNRKEWEARQRQRDRKQEQLQQRQQRKFEERIEPWVVPHVARVRAGEWVVLGEVRDLYPGYQENEAQAPEGENRIWVHALDAVTARHGITYDLGNKYTRRVDDPELLLRSSRVCLFLVPHGTHDPHSSAP